MTYVVEYRACNSGGYWWLSDQDWDKLSEAGWNVHWVEPREDYPTVSSVPTSAYEEPLKPVTDHGLRYIGNARAVSAAKTFERPEDAIEEFERITGQDASAEGCNCCGPPHTFEYEDAEGETHYATARVTATEISFS